MINVELRLLTKMLHSGNFAPIQQGEITKEHFVTEQGSILFNFITNYRSDSDGRARFPSLSIVRSRFEGRSAIELPDPDPGDTLEALVYETNVQRIKARMSTIAKQLEESALNASNPADALSASIGTLRTLNEGLHRARHLSLSHAIQDIVADYDIGNILPLGIPWRWPSYQEVTRGMHKKEFYVIAGRPKSRKTFVTLAAVVHAFMMFGSRILVFSPEMPAKQIMLRSIAMMAHLRYMEFKRSDLDQAETMRLIEAARTYGRLDVNEKDDQYYQRFRQYRSDMDPEAQPTFDVIESTGKSIGWMEAQIEAFAPDIVMADSFYRQHYDGKKNDSDWKAVTSTSRGIKDLAMSTNTCVIGTHQMNRGADKDVGTLSNLSLADAIGQDADMIVRVITGVLEGAQVSALVNLGGREVPFDGVLINNVPCSDFSEIAPITNKKTLETLMAKEGEADAEEEKRSMKKKALRRHTADHASSKELQERTQFESILDADVEDERELIEGEEE
jgi:replicative DNA helicase